MKNSISPNPKIMTTDNPFLPADYTPPASGSNYLKFQKGITKFRFISSPITGWVYFTEGDDGKNYPHRVRPNEKAPDARLKAKHFWAAIVYDYQSNSLKIIEITQKTVQGAILSLNANKSWGNPKEYDICVTRDGDGMDTEYTVMPEPKTKLDDSVYTEALSINLEVLYEGGDPFENLK